MLGWNGCATKWLNWITLWNYVNNLNCTIFRIQFLILVLYDYSIVIIIIYSTNVVNFSTVIIIYWTRSLLYVSTNMGVVVKHPRRGCSNNHLHNFIISISNMHIDMHTFIYFNYVSIYIFASYYNSFYQMLSENNGTIALWRYFKGWCSSP